MIEIKNLNKRYDNHIIFNHFNLMIPDQSLIAIVGDSGSGKTTLLNIIGLLEDYDSGEVYINNKKIDYNSKEAVLALRNEISYLFQNFALIDSMSVEENLKIVLEYRNISKKEKKDMISQSLENVGLNGIESRMVYTLSGGQQQRVALARVLLKNGSIVLCDEPTGSLDKKNSKIILSLLKKMRDNGKTVVIVTHDQSVADECDSILEI